MTRPTRRLLDLWGIGDDSFGILASTLQLPATPADAGDESMLGDRLVERPTFSATFEAHSTVPPSRLWSWVVQAMRGAGMYAWSRLDRPGSRPAARLLDGIPPPRVGDQLDGLLCICRLDPHVAIVWRNLVPLVFLDARIEDMTLDYRVEAARPGGSRLVARLRAAIDGDARSVSAHAACVLAFILPSSQASRLTQHADLDGRSKHRPFEPGARFQHLALTPAAASRRRRT